MSLNVLTQGGGTGGESASIFITGLSESDTVTATKGNKTVRGKWKTQTSGFTIPIKDYGMWTVTATNGEKTKTQDVLVDVAMDYEIEMDYRLWLYREGEEFEDVTGGWGIEGYSSSSHTLSPATKNTDNFYFSSTNTAVIMLGTLSAVDLSSYTTLKAEVNNTGTVRPDNRIVTLAIQSSKVREDEWLGYVGSDVIGEQTYELDVSNLSRDGYIVVYVGKDIGWTGYTYNIWLE